MSERSGLQAPVSNAPGIGIDIVRIDRIRHLVQRYPGKGLARVFSPRERKLNQKQADPAVHFAECFAVKEAIFKALETGWADGIDWRQIETLGGSGQALHALLHGEAEAKLRDLGFSSVIVSSSHTSEHATAIAVLVRDSE